MRRPTILSPTFVSRIRRPGRYGDGRGSFGLSLLVKEMANGRISKSWSQRVRLPGRLTNVGLGAYPIVSLSEARKAALENRRALAQGKSLFGGGVPTFAEASETVLAIHCKAWKPGSKSEDQWRSSLRDYAFPKIGKKRVDNITTGDVMGVLVPIWTTKNETANRVRQRISAVMKWAMAEGHRQDDPAGNAIRAALPKVNGVKKHMEALPHGKVAGAVAKVRQSGAYIMTKLAFEFVVLTAARSGEVRAARWDEIDLGAAVWTVPAERMKAKRTHRVPLSGRAVDILKEAREISDGSGLVFPSVRGRALSDMTMSKLVRELGIAAGAARVPLQLPGLGG